MKRVFFIRNWQRVAGGLALAAVLGAGGAWMVDRSHAASEQPGRQELLKAQKVELKDLERRQKSELADLKASQKAQRKEFEAEGKTQRRECFKKATRGSEKRDCVQGFLARRKAIIQTQGDEWRRRKDEQVARRRSLEEEQKRKLEEFDSGIVHSSAAPASR